MNIKLKTKPWVGKLLGRTAEFDIIQYKWYLPKDKQTYTLLNYSFVVLDTLATTSDEVYLTTKYLDGTSGTVAVDNTSFWSLMRPVNEKELKLIKSYEDKPKN